MQNSSGKGMQRRRPGHRERASDNNDSAHQARNANSTWTRARSEVACHEHGRGGERVGVIETCVLVMRCCIGREEKDSTFIDEGQ